MEILALPALDVGDRAIGRFLWAFPYRVIWAEKPPCTSLERSEWRLRSHTRGHRGRNRKHMLAPSSSQFDRCSRKSLLGGNKPNFLKLLMRFVRSDVRDHIVSQKNDLRTSYRHYRASQRRSSPRITICEIFGVVRFSTFSKASTRFGHGHGRTSAYNSAI
jgi:hypothetical protein